jgi:hypothetical protein
MATQCIFQVDRKIMDDHVFSAIVVNALIT